MAKEIENCCRELLRPQLHYFKKSTFHLFGEDEVIKHFEFTSQFAWKTLHDKCYAGRSFTSINNIDSKGKLFERRLN